MLEWSSIQIELDTGVGGLSFAPFLASNVQPHNSQ
jgi:hypothetical protein